MKTLTYKSFIGSAEIDVEEGICFGRILFINDLISYQSDTPRELQSEFEAAVEDYLETCSTISKEPEKTFTGQFNVRIPPDSHRQIAVLAAKKDCSLNALIGEAISQYLSGQQLRTQKVEHRHVVEVIVNERKTFTAGANDRLSWVASEGNTPARSKHAH
jgi:predicted HicB family RNase H-like nuclease